MTEDDRDPKTERAPAARTAAPPDDWLLVGQIVGTFGLEGDLKIRLETDFPERFASTATLYLGEQHRPRKVTGTRMVGPHVLIRLEGVEDATSAGKLREVALYVPASEAVPLTPDRFYLHDVIGLRVERPDGQHLGTVTDMYLGAGQDIFVIRAVGSGREVMVPSVKEMVKRVDVAAGVVIIEPIPGIFDEAFEVADEHESR